MKRLMIGLFVAAMCSSAMAADRAAAPTIGPTPQALQVNVSMTGSPLTGTCGYSSNLSWSATNASTCSKTGSWGPGTVAASGSETVTVNGPTNTFTLTCSSNTDSRELTWTNPTTNVDGSSTTLSGNKVFHSNAASTIDTQNPPIVLTPAKTGYLLTGLPAGPRVVGIKATGAAPNALDSAMSALASVNIVLPSGAITLQATCTPPPEPKPPTAVTIGSTVWDTKGKGNGLKIGTDVGFIALDVKCLGIAPQIIENAVDGAENDYEYWELDKNLTRIYPRVKPRPGILVGRCEVPRI